MAKVKDFRNKFREKVGHDLLFKDKVYSEADWNYQKSWKRYMPRPVTSFRVFYGFSPIVIFLTIVAVFICLYHAWLENIGAPKFWNTNNYLWQPFSLSSFCLALLLVHRTTASYNRWWEARTVWGGLLNVTRNLTRQAAAPWGFHDNPVLLEMFARWVTAMPYCLKAHLRQESLRADLEPVLAPEELEYLLEASQPCLRCAQVASSIVGKALPGPDHQQTRVWVDEQMVLYVNYVGACERIIKTAIPVAFTRHLTRFLLTWLLLLPFCLWPVIHGAICPEIKIRQPLFQALQILRMGWATPAAQCVLSFLLLGTENIGIQVEEPFCIMTMDAFCRSCESSIVEIMETYRGAAEFVDVVAKAGGPRGFRRRAQQEDTNEPPAENGSSTNNRKSLSNVHVKIRL